MIERWPSLINRKSSRRNRGLVAWRLVYSSAVSRVAEWTCRLPRIRRVGNGEILQPTPATWESTTQGLSSLVGPPMSEVTRILSAIEQGDPSVAEQLLPLVYDELRRLAAQKLAQEKPGQTLQATALVHEAYLRLVGIGEGPHWDSRRHF